MSYKDYNNVVQTDEDVLNDLLKQEQPKKEEKDLDVLKELFTKKDIETKTELFEMQVVLMNQKRVIAKMLDWASLDNALDDFMLLMVSKNRKGRAEFVDGFKSEREQQVKQQSGFFSEIGKKLGGKS